MPEMESWTRKSSRGSSRGRDRERDGAGMGRSRGCSEGIHIPGKGIVDLKQSTGAGCGIGSLSEENMRNSSRKDRLPIKMLIDEEMAKEFEPRRASSSVVAKLMGLDSFPIPRSGHIKKKESEKCSHISSVVGSRETHVSSTDPSFSSAKDLQQSNAFEAYHTYQVDQNHDPPNVKGRPKLNRSESDVKFIKQKFLDAKRLVVDGKLYDSKDFNDALDVLDSNKDLVLKFLQEPSSLLAKHVHDFHQAPSKSKSSNITILRPSKFNDCDFSSKWSSEKEVKGHMQIKRHNLNGSRKIHSDMICHSAKEQSLSRSCKIAKSKFEKKVGHCSLPTRIVILKPTVERVQVSDSVSFPSCTEKSPFVYRKKKELRSSHNCKLFSDVRDYQKLSNDVVSSHRVGSLVSLPQASKYTSHIVTNNYWEVSTTNKDVQKKREKFTLPHGRPFQRQSSCHFDDWKRKIMSPLHSSKSSLSREAKKRLSERWRISNRFQKEPFFEFANQGSSSTLGEMLALSDKEIFTHDFKNDMHPMWEQPSGINRESRDGCKGEYSRRLARSRSLPGSSSSQLNSRRTRTASFGDEDYVILKDILNQVSDKSPESSKIYKEVMPFQNVASNSKLPCVDPVLSGENEFTLHELHSKSGEYHTSILTDDKHEPSETSGAVYYDAVALVDGCNDVENSHVSTFIESEMPPCDISVESVEDAATICKNLILEETSVRQCHDATSDNSHPSEPESPITREQELFVIAKDAEQPSPVSVLEPLEEEEEEVEDDTSPECFERLNTDIQGLRLQLQLLRMESGCEDIDESDVSCDEETHTDGVIPRHTEIFGVSTDNDERDFSYLVDMLADSGLQDVTMDMVSSVCHLPECPVSPHVFERLETIYEEPSVWTRSERKLMFDLVNFILTDLVVPHVDPRPWIKPPRNIKAVKDRKLTVDELWHVFVERRSTLMCDSSLPIMDACWLDLGDIIDMMGMEIEKMLKDELLDEVLSDLVT